MKDFNLDQLEAEVLAAPITETAQLTPEARGDAPADPVTPDAENGPDNPASIGPVPTPADLLDQAAFIEALWDPIHDMAGGMVEMRTGQPCPLGDQARNPGGRAAAAAMYQLALSNPTIARLILGTESTFLGQLAAIGMHGFGCVQIAKASVLQGAEARHAAFTSSRGEAGE